MKNKKIFKKSHIDKKIDEVNEIMDSLAEINGTIDYVTDTLVLCGGEVVDRKNGSSPLLGKATIQ